jgi:hypothetical protein
VLAATQHDCVKVTADLQVVHLTNRWRDLSGRVAIRQICRVTPVVPDENWVMRRHPHASVKAHLRVAFWIAVIGYPHTSHSTVCFTVGREHTITDDNLAQAYELSIITHEHPRVAPPAYTSHPLISNILCLVVFLFYLDRLLQQRLRLSYGLCQRHLVRDW